MRLCSVPGCEKKHCARGWCKMHYYRWYYTGDAEHVPTPCRVGLAVPLRGAANPQWQGGKISHPLYRTWTGMRYRCSSPNDTAWLCYGGRGIQVCDRWQQDFWAFVEDVGPKPSPDHTLDRIDNDGNYEPGNVRWATRKEQADNRRVRA